MLKKRHIYYIKRFCSEDISKIENYDKAISDKSKTVWDCHHKLEIKLNKSYKELKEIGLYYNRPASELIFLTHSEHARMHQKDRLRSQEARDKISKSITGEKHPMYGKHHSQETREKMQKPKKKNLWLTPNGETKTMSINHAKRYHPDWVLIGEA